MKLGSASNKNDFNVAAQEQSASCIVCRRQVFEKLSSFYQDIDMHYEPTDTAAMARTSNLNEELGQVGCFLKLFSIVSNS